MLKGSKGLKILNVFILVFALQGCGEEQQDSAIISVDEQVCLDQSQKNIAMWDYMDDWYLWRDSLDQSTPVTEFESLAALLVDIKAKNPIDRYSFVISKQESDDLFINAQTFGYGMGYRVDDLTNELVVTFVYQQSNAEKIGLRRGDRITEIAGHKLSALVTHEAFSWPGFWEEIDQHTLASFTWRKLDGTTATNTMIASTVTTNTVFATEVIDSSAGSIGYLVYNSFIVPSQEDLNQAFTYFNEQGVDELIVDLRYNHGGASTISNQLASQIGGDNVLGQVYNAPTNNSNHVSDVEYFNLNNATHYLNLSKVVFITTAESASGSEVLINSLKPYLAVKLVGQKTFGKPVGMLLSQLCDEVVFAITHHNHNADGEGDFFDGIEVDCPAIDTVAGDWGSSKDPMLTEALYLLENGQCSPLAAANKPSEQKSRPSEQSYRDFFLSKPFGTLLQ